MGRTCDSLTSPIYLPTYSLDMNPIELCWAHLKRTLRKLGARTVEALALAVRRLRAATRVEHIASWIAHALSFAQVN